MARATVGEVITGLWRFQGTHPEWTPDEGGDEDGWDPIVAWWALATPDGLVLIDPLVTDWDALDRLLGEHGGCAGVVRTCHWHQRSIADVSARQGAQVWAGPNPQFPADHAVADGDVALDGVRMFDMERHDEVALWLPVQRALVFGDAMLRRADGELRVCPDSWTQPPGGPARLRELLRALTDLPVEHVLVSHGPLVLGDGLAQLRAATGLQ